MSTNELIPVKLSDGTVIRIEVTQLAPQPARDVPVGALLKVPDLDDVWRTISAIASSIGTTLTQAKAKKAVVELGVEIGAEAGQLTALLVKATAKANLT